MERRPTSAAPEAALVGQRSLLTSRAILLALVILVGFGTTAIPIKQLLEQRDRIAVLESQVAANEATIKRLEGNVSRWEDPAYVQSQVRKHLHWVMPGEIGFFITESDDIPAVEQFVITPTKKSEVWYSVLWRSLKSAPEPAAPVSGK